MKIRTAKLDSFVTMYKRSFEKALPSPEHIRKLSSTGGHGKGRKSIEFGCLFFVQLGDSIAFCLTIQILRCDKKRRHAEDIYIFILSGCLIRGCLKMQCCVFGRIGLGGIRVIYNIHIYVYIYT